MKAFNVKNSLEKLLFTICHHRKTLAAFSLVFTVVIPVSLALCLASLTQVILCLDRKGKPRRQNQGLLFWRKRNALLDWHEWNIQTGFQSSYVQKRLTHVWCFVKSQFQTQNGNQSACQGDDVNQWFPQGSCGSCLNDIDIIYLKIYLVSDTVTDWTCRQMFLDGVSKPTATCHLNKITIFLAFFVFEGKNVLCLST